MQLKFCRLESTLVYQGGGKKSINYLFLGEVFIPCVSKVILVQWNINIFKKKKHFVG